MSTKTQLALSFTLVALAALGVALASLGDVDALEALQKRSEIEPSAPVRVALQRAIERLTGTNADSEKWRSS